MALYHVTLDGQGYMLDLSTYRKSVGSLAAPKQREGDLDYGDFTQLSVWAQEDWRGGLGFEDYEAVPGNQYNTGVFIDSAFGDLRVGPVLTSVHAPASVSDLWRFLAGYANSVACVRGDGAQIYTSTDGITWSNPYTPGTVGSWRGVGKFNNLALFGSSTNGEIHRSDGSTFALWGTVGGSPTQVGAIKEWWRSYASRLAYLGVTKSSGRASLYKADTTPTFTEIFETTYDRIEALEVWDDALWIGALSDTNSFQGALYRYDGTNVQLITEIPANGITAFTVFKERLYAASANHGKVWQVTTQGLTQIFQIPDVIQIGGASAYALDIRQMVVHNDRLYLPVVDADGLGVYQFDGQGWAKPSTGGLGQEPRGITFHNGALLLCMKNTNDARIYRVAQTASTSATFVSGWFDAGLALADKILVRITIRHSALASGEAVQVEYALDDSGTWTNLGTSDTDGATEKTFTFATGTKAKKVRLRLTLTLVTTTATPRVRSTLLEYQVAPDLKAQWTFETLLEGTTELPLILLDQAASPLTGAQLADALWASKAKKQTLSFTDIDGEVKTVLFQDLEEKVAQRSQREGYSTRGRVTLVEA